MVDYDKLQETLERIVLHFEKTAPTVSNWANDLYIRLAEDIDSVRLVEIRLAGRIYSREEGLMQPSEAANQVFKLMHRLGQDTTGQAGF
jgi:hypothetical protein